MAKALKLIALVAIVVLTCSSCTSRSDIGDTTTTSTSTVEPPTLVTNPPQTPTTVVSAFTGLTIDDLILSRSSSSNISSISADAVVSCESAVLALSTVMQLLMSELDEVIADAEMAIESGLPPSEIVRLFDPSAEAASGTSNLTSGLSQQLGIGGAVEYSRLLNQAMHDLELSGLVQDSSIDTSEQIDFLIRAVDETVESIRDQELIVRQPVWECPELRP